MDVTHPIFATACDPRDVKGRASTTRIIEPAPLWPVMKREVVSVKIDSTTGEINTTFSLNPDTPQTEVEVW